jgi:hypothetical protein
MTFFPKTKIEYADSPAIDAAGRLRMSTPYTLFDNKQVTDDRQLYWSTKFLSGASSSYSSFQAATTLTASSTPGSIAIRQSKVRANYQSGKSLLMNCTFLFGESVVGMRKRAGLFDDNNGIFAELSGSNKNLVIRSNVSGTPTDQVITQSAWNLDKFDGTGPSGHVLDFSKTQLFHTDLEWLGVGRVRMGFNISGSLIYAHELLNANVSASIYMSSPNLPVRYEVENISAVTQGTINQICSTISSEGGYDALGTLRTVDRAVTSVTGVTSAGLVPIVSMRLKQSYVGTTVRPIFGQVLCTTNATFRWALVLNPTVGPIDNASWTSLLSSSIQYDTSRNASNALTGGLVIASGYANNSSDTSERDILSSLILGTNIDNSSDELILAAQVVGGTTEQFLGTLSFKEFI